MKQIYLAGIVLLFAMHAHSQTNTYSGPSGGSWGTSTNWSLNIVPTNAHNVIIPNNVTVNIGATAVCNTLVINGGGQPTTLNVNLTTLTVSGAITINAGTGSGDNKTINVNAGTLSAGSITMLVTGDDNRVSSVAAVTGTINVTGAITMNDADPDRNAVNLTFSALNVGGSVTGGALSATNISTVNYNGASAQNVRGTPYYNLTFSGGGAKTLDGPASVSNTATFTDGVVNTTSTNLLTLANGSTLSGVNNTSFVQGPVRKIGNSAFDFPVGAAGVGYHPISISAPGSTTDQFTAEYVRASGSALGPITVIGLYGVSNCEYWRLNRNVGSSNVNVTLSWTATSPCSGAYITSLIGLQVAGFNGTSWNTSAGNGASGNTTAGTVVRNAVSVFGNGTTTFSSFAISNVNAAGSPLPAIYGNVKAFSRSNGVQVDWEVLSETEVDHYSVERSLDGRQFVSIGQQPALLNNGSRVVYSFTDAAPVNGINYYRIKSIEVTGKSRYTIIVKVDTRKGITEITVYPNPVQGNTLLLQATDLMKGKYTMSVYNMTGQEVHTQSLVHTGGSTTVTIQLPSAIQKGMYQLKVMGELSTTTRPFIVQ
jgi:hypothetical protein